MTQRLTKELLNKTAPKTKEEARAFLKSVGLLKTYRAIKGEERKQVETMLALVPYEDSNNQRFWCRTWKVGNTTYNHYSGSGMDDLEEVTEDE
jgi:ribosomal protein L30/L7E